MPALWVPPGVREKRRKCLTCGMEFPDRQREQWQRHAIRCAEKNEDVIEEAVAVKEASAFTSIYDKEQYRFERQRAAQRGEI